MRWLPVIATTFLIAGCSCTEAIAVRVSGSLQEGVTFALPESSTAAARRVNVLDVYIRDIADPPGSAVWSIQGSARVEAIIYGEVPYGMTESLPAKQLTPGRTYEMRARAHTGGTLGPPCHGRVRFTVRADGAAIACNETGITCG